MKKVYLFLMILLICLVIFLLIFWIYSTNFSNEKQLDNRPYYLQDGIKHFYDIQDSFLRDIDGTVDSEFEKFKESGKICISDRETALKIGKAILKENYPEYFNGYIKIDVGESNGYWKVFSVENLKGPMLGSGGISVTFKKTTGEIVKLGIDD